MLNIFLKSELYSKNPAYGRHWISRPRGSIQWTLEYKKIWFLTRGGRGVWPLSDYSNNGGEGRYANFWFWVKRGGGREGLQTPILAKIICEHPLDTNRQSWIYSYDLLTEFYCFRASPGSPEEEDILASGPDPVLQRQ